MGEITTYPGPVANRGIAAMLREVGPLLVGEDPAHIEAIWNKLFRVFTYMGSRGATTAMVSGVDIALWDIRGMVIGQPIYMLLGGPVRESIPLYTHYGYTPDVETFVETALTEVRAGVTAIKTDPFFEARAGVIAFTNGQIGAAAEERGVGLIAAVREAVGPGVTMNMEYLRAHAVSGWAGESGRDRRSHCAIHRATRGRVRLNTRTGRSPWSVSSATAVADETDRKAPDVAYAPWCDSGAPAGAVPLRITEDRLCSGSPRTGADSREEIRGRTRFMFAEVG